MGVYAFLLDAHTRFCSVVLLKDFEKENNAE